MGRPPKTIYDLDQKLGTAGDIVEMEPSEKPKARKEPENYIFEMVGDFPKDPENGTIRYPYWGMQNSQLVYDEETGTTRMARLIRGHSSIWVDDQKDLDEKYVARNKPNLAFNNGQLVIPAADKNTIKFLMLRSDFAGCKQPAVNMKTRYRLIDTEGEESKRLELKKKIKDAHDKAWAASMEDLIPHAKFLGITFTNAKGLDKTPEALRADYVDKAQGAGLKDERAIEQQVDLFLRTYQNPKVKMYGLVKKAFEQDIIVFIDGQAIWNDTKVVICQVPHDKNVADYLAEMMLTKEGAELKARLETI